MKHSQEFIKEMEGALLEEKKVLEAELSALGTKHEGDFRPNIPEYGRDDDDNVTEAADYEALASTTETIEDQLASVVAALKRIEDGTYGVTAEGETIPEERLRANPSATTLIAS